MSLYLTWISLNQTLKVALMQGLETKLQISLSITPIHNIPSPWTEHARCGPDLSSHHHCSYKQIGGFTHGTESCCAAFSHFLLDWRKRGSRVVPQHFSNGEKKISKTLRARLFIRFQFIRFTWQPRSCVRERKATTLEKTPKIFPSISKVLQGHKHQW